jgi:hypothetical protein
MPHTYFSKIIPEQRLAVIRFVSIVFRFTEGYQTQFGRRKSIPLSFSNIHKLANIRSPSVLSQTISHCLKSNFVELVQAGKWAPGEGESKAAVYGPKYASDNRRIEKGSKTEADLQFKKRSGASVQKPKQNQFKNRSPVSSKNEAVEGFKKRSPINNLGNTLQTMQEIGKSQKLLMATGFKEQVARKIAMSAECEVIENQISWMRFRKNVDKPLGFLKKAIEQNWDEPEASQVRTKERRVNQQKIERQQAVETWDSQFKQKVAQHRNRLIKIWERLPWHKREQLKQLAIDSEAESCRAYLLRKSVEDRPPMAFLDQVAHAESLLTTSEFEARIKSAVPRSEIAASDKPLTTRGKG